MLHLTIRSMICMILLMTFVSYENLAVDIGQEWSLCK